MTVYNYVVCVCVKYVVFFYHCINMDLESVNKHYIYYVKSR